MKEFVAECRSEWKRLGVPDPVADEMAAELEADLKEAEADGVSAEDVLGRGASDPRSFAAFWAAERGVVPRTPPNAHRSRRTVLTAVVTGALALIAVIGGVLVIVASPSDPKRLALTGDGGIWVNPLGQVAVSPDGRSLAYLGPRAVLRPVPPAGVRAVVAPPARVTPIVTVDITDSGVDTQTVGWVLLTVGLAGVIPMTILLSWADAGPWSRRRTHLG